MPELGGNPQNIYSSWNPVNKCFGFLFFLLIELAPHKQKQSSLKFTETLIAIGKK